MASKMLTTIKKRPFLVGGVATVSLLYLVSCTRMYRAIISGSRLGGYVHSTADRTRKSYTGRPMSLLIPRALLAKCSTHLRGCSAFLICCVSCTRGHTSHEDPDPFICPQVTRITHMTHGNAVTHPLAFVLHPSYHRHRTHPRERKHVESRSCIARRLVIHHPPESLLSENCTM